MKRNITLLLCVLALSGAPAVADAQEIEPVENLKVDAYYQEWLADYEETGTKINEISETYQKEVDRRGYPKKKTVRAKMEAVKHYIELLEQQLTDPRLNQNIDTLKINKKIELWKQQYEGLGYLLKKI